LGLSFGAMALGPTPMASKLMGYMTPNNEYVRTPYRDAVEHGGVFLVDELDGSFPGTLVEAINEVAAASPGDVVAFPDGMVTVHEDFRLLGGGNTPMRGADGTYSARAGADGSTHTRFVFVHMPYDLALERDIVLAVMGDDAATDAWLSDVRRWREAVDTHGLNGYVISPREAIQGAKALARGADRDDVLTDCVFKGWNAEARRKVERV
jgi:cobaltochelatase CobS